MVPKLRFGKAGGTKYNQIIRIVKSKIFVKFLKAEAQLDLRQFLCSLMTQKNSNWKMKTYIPPASQLPSEF